MLQDNDLQAVQKLNEAYRLVTEQLGRVIVGQQHVIEELLIAIFAKGHCLLVGVPGLAKTLMIRTLAEALETAIQPHSIYARPHAGRHYGHGSAPGGQSFRQPRLQQFLKGPIFANVILADEINRTPPKTQAALLEAMQEHQITAGGSRHRLAEPFFVLATQNPIEHEGTYPLPEAQLDRFMFHILVDYPSEEEEFQIVRQTTADVETTIAATLSGEQIIELQRIVRRVPVADHVIRYALDLVRRTRSSAADAPDFVRSYVQWGAGPRASQYLILGAKARAVLQGRYFAGCEDVRAVAGPVLRHRILTNFNAEAEGIKPDEIVRRLIETSKSRDGDGAGDVFKTAVAAK